MDNNTKKIDVGRITGLDAYELAVKYRGFTGSREDYVNQEMKIYNDTKDYSDAIIADMDRRLAALTNNRASDMNEVIEARGANTTLGNRITQIESAVEKTTAEMEAIERQTTVMDSAMVNSDGDLILTLIDTDSDAPLKGEFQMRNTGAQIQWRINGVTEWKKLAYIRDFIPDIKIGKVNFVSEDKAHVTIESIGAKKLLLNMDIPRVDVLSGIVAESGYHGISIKSPNGTPFNITVNDSGELVVSKTEN